MWSEERAGEVEDAAACTDSFERCCCRRLADAHVDLATAQAVAVRDASPSDSDATSKVSRRTRPTASLRHHHCPPRRGRPWFYTSIGAGASFDKGRRIAHRALRVDDQGGRQEPLTVWHRWQPSWRKRSTALCAYAYSSPRASCWRSACQRRCPSLGGRYSRRMLRVLIWRGRSVLRARCRPPPRFLSGDSARIGVSAKARCGNRL